MAGKGKETRVRTPEFRVSFPQLFEAKSFQDGKAKYSVVMVFDKKADISALKRAANEALVAKWPDPKTRPKIKTPFRDGSEKEHLEGFGDGVIFVTATTTRRPAIVDRSLTPITSEESVYAGCYARAMVSAFAYDWNNMNRGVSFGLHSVQFLRDGEPLAGGGGNPEEDYDDLPPEYEDAFNQGDDTAGLL